MPQKYRIVIAEDHTILREGLRSLLSSNSNFEIVGEAEDGREAIHCVEKLKPNLVLTDLSMPRMNGMDAIREIKKKSPETKILVLTVHKTEEYILATLQAGADGYLLKDSTHSELLMAVNHVLSGKRYIRPGISDKVLEGYLDGRKTLKTETAWETLGVIANDPNIYGGGMSADGAQKLRRFVETCDAFDLPSSASSTSPAS